MTTIPAGMTERDVAKTMWFPEWDWYMMGEAQDYIRGQGSLDELIDKLGKSMCNGSIARLPDRRYEVSYIYQFNHVSYSTPFHTVESVNSECLKSTRWKGRCGDPFVTGEFSAFRSVRRALRPPALERLQDDATVFFP